MKIRVKIIRSAARIGYAYTAGQEIELPSGLAEEFIELGIAVKSHRKSELPEDFPGYKVLIENGYTSFGEIRKIGTVEQLRELKGIGQKLAESIVEHLNK